MDAKIIKLLSNTSLVNDCWEWRGEKDKQGYGRIYRDGRKHRTHRYSWILFNSYIPEGKWVLHSCDNPSCVNPSHLYIGTNIDNIADRQSKRRQAVGSKHGSSKLAEEDIIDIRSSQQSSRIIGEIYGVDPSTIRVLRRRETWKHI